MITRVVELINKVSIDGQVTFLAECNDYNELGIKVQQLSRSPFTFPDTMTDEEIIDIIKNNEYKLYF